VTVTAGYSELDWPGALLLAGRFCATERGLGLMQATEPSPEPAEVTRRLGVTRDLKARRALRPPVALGGLDEAVPLLARLGPQGRALPPEDLLDLFVLVERSEGARAAVPVPDLDLPHLARLLSPLADLSDLLAERAITFEADGRIKDTATARLLAIRSALLRLRRDVVKRLEELTRTRPGVLSEEYVTEKSGRYCVPVRVDRKESVPGIVHEKSGSGQTLFIEPLEAVEANNALAEALEEEREEIRRILVALTGRFSSRRAELQTAAAILAELDASQARAEFASRTVGIFPVFGERVVLKGARHPLLDRRLAALREEAFGENAEERHADAVPLDLEVEPGQRLVLLSGPNAGGKSVAMKTVGLFALLAQSGFALPAEAGTTLPVFDQILVVSGDAQDLLGDLSSFAAAMTRTAAVLEKATKRSLVLLDELGSGTDPDEGAALAIAVLESDRRRGGLTIATTHLSAVKEWAHGQPDVLSAAMEFDEKRGMPTFRIRPGATGRSRALAVAEKSGIPARVLSAAKERLGSKWAAADAALARLERETQAAREEAGRARAAEARLSEQLAGLEKEHAALAAERARLKEKAKEQIDRALEALRERTRRELDRLREELKAGRSLSRGALMTVTHSAREAAMDLFSEEETDETPKGTLTVGGLVRVQPYNTIGRLISLSRGKGEAEVDVSGKKMKVPVSSLAPLPGSAAADSLKGKKAPARGPARGESRSSSSSSSSNSPVAMSEILLVGERVDAALPMVEKAINDALLSGKGALRIVHGHGTGRLAAAVREFLGDHPGVASYRSGDAREGGNAVTIAVLDV
jgi:DNA mismatch repair protein MutS2